VVGSETSLLSLQRLDIFTSHTKLIPKEFDLQVLKDELTLPFNTENNRGCEDTVKFFDLLRGIHEYSSRNRDVTTSPDNFTWEIHFLESYSLHSISLLESLIVISRELHLKVS
jgi:hypothetical protein